MKWKKLGIVWSPDGSSSWAQSHAMAPTPYRLNNDTLRIFVTCLDSKGRGRPVFVDVSASDPRKILGVSTHPVLDIGEPGCFDDNGVMALSIVEIKPGLLYMYYAGFELCTHIRYRIFTGLAISHDEGLTFRRVSRAPILDRSDEELYFRCGPFTLLDNNIFKMWYVAGSKWTEIFGKSMPTYDLRYQESMDGIHWGNVGEVVMPITGIDEHGFGRPWIIKRSEFKYEMHYSIRRRSFAAYRLGYAESSDGRTWTRMDTDLGLDISTDGFDSHAIMYSAVIKSDHQTFCFYNGDDFGKIGFAVAVLEN